MGCEQHRDEVGTSHWLSGGGAAGELIASKTWGATSLGPIEQWPQCLRTALDICLALPVPACIAWGRERSQLYNDRYAELAANALGEDFASGWRESWPEMRASFDRAFGGEQVMFANFSFAPIRDEAGGVGGVFVTLVDPAAAALRLELARVNRELEEYGYVISHDFRSPLRTLEQMSRIVAGENASGLPLDVANLLKHVARGAAILADRADAVSRVAQLSELTLERRRVDVKILADEAIAELRAATADRHIEIVVGELPSADADAKLLRLVLASLLSNAFKFTRNVPHARVQVHGSRQGHQNVYSVSDNGVGFDMKYAEKLYGFFQRLHTDAQFEGIGIGLVLARRLVERMDGTIWAQARPDHGATFHFTLPA